MSEHITVLIRPDDKAFVKADKVTIIAEIDGETYTSKATIPENFFTSRFDQLLHEVRNAVIEAHAGTIPVGEEN